MILTEYLISTERGAGRYLLQWPYRLHSALYKAFPHDGRMLYRADHDPDAAALSVLVQHTALAPERLDLPGCLQWAPRSRVLHGSEIQAGKTYFFRLAAAPTVSEFERGQRGKVRAIRDHDGLDAWLRGKMSGAAEIVHLEHFAPAMVRVKKPGMEYSFFRTVYQGVLACQDADALAALRASGLGRQKNMGCGLLTLREVAVE